jgi:hypothetical protein
VLNLLYIAGAAAAQRLVALHASMAAHSDALDSVGGQLTAVAQQQVPQTSSHIGHLRSRCYPWRPRVRGARRRPKTTPCEALDMLPLQAQLAVSVGDSLVSLDSLHTAAGNLDIKLQHTVELQVWWANHCLLHCYCMLALVFALHASSVGCPPEQVHLCTSKVSRAAGSAGASTGGDAAGPVGPGAQSAGGNLRPASGAPA